MLEAGWTWRRVAARPSAWPAGARRRRLGADAAKPVAPRCSRHSLLPPPHLPRPSLFHPPACSSPRPHPTHSERGMSSLERTWSSASSRSGVTPLSGEPASPPATETAMEAAQLACSSRLPRPGWMPDLWAVASLVPAGDTWPAEGLGGCRGTGKSEPLSLCILAMPGAWQQAAAALGRACASWLCALLASLAGSEFVPFSATATGPRRSSLPACRCRPARPLPNAPPYLWLPPEQARPSSRAATAPAAALVRCPWAATS